MSADAYRAFHQQSIENPDAFWREQAKRIEWREQPRHILDFSKPPFARWFVGGTTNLCHNAVDRHLATRADQPAVIYVTSELLDGDKPQEKVYTYAQLHTEVNRMAAIMKSLGVGKGDRVLIYMPMIAEALFAMLACVRIGAIHSVVFGGFASHSLATRIDDATPKLVVSADAGSRAGKPVPYKPLLDAAIDLAQHKPDHVLLVDRKLAQINRVEGRDQDYATLAAKFADAQVPCEWLESNEPSYVLYTSGTTGKPKGVQRDTGGYAVALAASMEYIFDSKPGETFFATSDIGWVVGHSYIVYGPLLNGMATVFYEGTPVRPDGAVWWSIVEKYRVTTMFSAPTAARVLKKLDPALLTRHDLSSLRALYLAGEPLDEPTAVWIGDALKKPIIDNYWQTETGWPMITVQRGVPGCEDMPTKLGSPGKPAYGFDLHLLDETTGADVPTGEKGVIAVRPPLPPGCLSTVWRDDERFVSTYFSLFEHATLHPGQYYSSFDWGIQDADGYTFVLGRTDDVINVAGHRLGTREIEESISAHPNVAEVAVVGVADQLKGQVPVAFVIVKNAASLTDEASHKALEAEVFKLVDSRLGAVGRPSRVHFVPALPKTRSGKLLRRAMQAVCEGRDPGDLTTIEDPTALAQIQAAASPKAKA
jgi:propionyl-CoA synthetase